MLCDVQLHLFPKIFIIRLVVKYTYFDFILCDLQEYLFRKCLLLDSRGNGLLYPFIIRNKSYI